MGRPSRRALVVLKLGALALGAAALFHAVAVFVPIATDSPGWRHGLFAAVDAVAALGLLVRPRYFAIPFGLLTAQQLVSHGTAAYRAFTEQARVDWVSLGVLSVMPLLLAALLSAGPRRSGRVQGSFCAR